MKKAKSLKHWQEMEANQPVLPHFVPIPYKTSGSRYGCCGIRIDGNPKFIDAVLSRLKDLIDGENQVTRFELARNKVKRSEGYAAGQNAESGVEVCYIRLHKRGYDAAMVNAMFDKSLAPATDRFVDAQISGKE